MFEVGALRNESFRLAPRPLVLGCTVRSVIFSDEESEVNIEVASYARIVAGGMKESSLPSIERSLLSAVGLIRTKTIWSRVGNLDFSASSGLSGVK